MRGPSCATWRRTERENMTQTHTPGPWFESAEDGDKICDSNGYPVAEIDTPRCESETNANARLIAAAPEMLAALKALLFDCLHGNGAETWEQHKDAARAAISRATNGR